MENGPLNMEGYIKEFASLLADVVQATVKMFEEEHMRMNGDVDAPWRNWWRQSSSQGHHGAQGGYESLDGQR